MSVMNPVGDSMFSKKIRDLMIEQDISLQKLADTSVLPFETYVTSIIKSKGPQGVYCLSACTGTGCYS